MNYLVLGLVLLAAAVWVVVIVIGVVAKGVDATARMGRAAAHRFGYNVGRLFVDGTRYLSRNWISIDIPESLARHEVQLIDAHSSLKAFRSWRPAPISESAEKFSKFTPFVFPDLRRVGSAIHVSDLIGLGQMTSPPPAETLRQLATHDCTFPDPAPPPLLRQKDWPQPMPSLSLALPNVQFQLLRSDPFRRFIALRAYRKERTAALSTASRIAKLKRDADALNASIAEANRDLAQTRLAYETDYQARCSSIAANHRAASNEFATNCSEARSGFRAIIDAYENAQPSGVLSYFRYGLRLLALPNWASTSFELGFDESGQALVIQVELPNLPDVKLTKAVTTRSGRISHREPTKREVSQVLKTLHPLVLLRIACEAARHDVSGKVEMIAVNGWVSFRLRSTGQPQTAFVASLVGSPTELRGISLSDADALVAFQSFRGQSAFVVDDVVPMRPALVLDRKDPRFVASKEVMRGLETQMNLATIDWQDFEHLIREVFEKLYKGQGVEVRVTQASRDRGVDAVILDPDPIRGGKIVIQAKRYVNTVDVSSVRDLYGTVHNEGASRGILITTSSFGPDSYQFAQGKPLTLLNGSQLLDFLKEIGKNVRIDLDEARRLAQVPR